MAEETLPRTEEQERALSEHVAERDMIKFMIYRSSGILYGINTEYVDEILTDVTATQVPMVPEYISGVINLRGQIVPIVDFRLLLGRFPGEESCAIILTIEGTVLGILVDSVDQIVDVTKSSILPVPTQNNNRLVYGMTTLPGGTGTVMLLDAPVLLHMDG